jgi:hypothetical protein
MIFHTQQRRPLEEIDWLIGCVPGPCEIDVRGEADYYGASFEVAEAIGLTKAPASYGTWKHGWNCVPTLKAEAIAGYRPGPRTHLVGDEEQELMLRQAGYPNAIAVGYPILYAKASETVRKRSSLLLAPSHSLPEITPHAEQKQNEICFAQYIKGLSGQFDVVCAMLHSSCLDSRLWVDTLEEFQIPWVLGAMTNDSMGLRRVKALLCSFETVLTNQLTSVVLYAAAFGARVSIAGPSALQPPIENIAKHPHYQKHPELLKNLELRHPDRLKALFPHLFVEPQHATCPVEWADKELGKKHVVRHEDVARLLGWRFVDGDPFWNPGSRSFWTMTLGNLPSSIGSQEVLEGIGRFLESEGLSGVSGLEDLKARSKTLENQKKLEKALDKTTLRVEECEASWSWRIVGRVLFKFEKWVRRQWRRLLSNSKS